MLALYTKCQGSVRATSWGLVLMGRGSRELKLAAREDCAVRGPKTAQSENHTILTMGTRAIACYNLLEVRPHEAP